MNQHKDVGVQILIVRWTPTIGVRSMNYRLMGRQVILVPKSPARRSHSSRPQEESEASMIRIDRHDFARVLIPYEGIDRSGLFLNPQLSNYSCV
jgi:hypothetical protein